MTKKYSSYMVSLDVYTAKNASLTEGAISDMLGLRNMVTKSRVDKSGDVLWRYDSRIDEYEPIEAHIRAILSLIASDQPVKSIEPIRNIYLNVAVFCTHFFSCTVMLPAELTASIASKFPDFELVFTFYKSAEDEEDEDDVKPNEAG